MLETLSIHAYIKGKIVEVLCNMANLGPTLFGGFFFFRLDIKLRNNFLVNIRTSLLYSLNPTWYSRSSEVPPHTNWRKRGIRFLL